MMRVSRVAFCLGMMGLSLGLLAQPNKASKRIKLNPAPGGATRETVTHTVPGVGCRIRLESQ
jgi:hypothetical protein